MKKITLFAAVLLLTASAVAAQPAPDGRTIVLQGNGHGAAACSSCHGAELQGDPKIGAPAISGRPAAFIQARLAHYAGPQGHNPLMRQVARSLTPAERYAVAQYISHQLSKTGPRGCNRSSSADPFVAHEACGNAFPRGSVRIGY
jgi:cytochrome c553